jgi:hypothetical protein
MGLPRPVAITRHSFDLKQMLPSLPPRLDRRVIDMKRRNIEPGSESISSWCTNDTLHRMDVVRDHFLLSTRRPVKDLSFL